MRRHRFDLVAALVLVAVVCSYLAALHGPRGPQHPPADELELGRWYCCLGDEHPRRIEVVGPAAGAFGGVPSSP